MQLLASPAMDTPFHRPPATPAKGPCPLGVERPEANPLKASVLPRPQCGPGRLLPCPPLPPPKHQQRNVGHSSASSLRSRSPRGQKHPGPHPAEESPTRNSSSPSNTAQARHEGSYGSYGMLSPLWTCASNALCGLSAAKSWWWGLPHCAHPPPAHHPTQGCCAHGEATQLPAGAGDADF